MRLFLLTTFIFATGAVAQSAADSAELVQRIAAVEARVAQAESLRAIKRLQYAYGHYVEFGLWHDFADLFAADAVAHYPAGGLGREAVRELFFDQVGQGRLGLADGRLYPHFVLQPVVTLDPGGTTAHGRWHVLTLLGGYGGNASWVGSLYENDYVLEAGVWKIGELRTYTQFSGAYAGGWTIPRIPGTAPEPDGPCENYVVNDCTNPFRYDAAGVGAPLGAAIAAVPRGPTGSGGTAAPSLDELNGRAAEIDRRVARLRDESEVINLQHAYGYYVDRKLWDDVVDLFATGATLELGLQGVYRGQASIRRALEQFGPQDIANGEVNDHLQLETIVTVAPAGNRAQARGIDFALRGTENKGESRAEWRESVFENSYVKENGVWKIAAMHLYPRFATDYALGWAEDASPAPVASAEFPPDEPPTVMHAHYPEFYAPPFHFTNPVTGVPPQYPDGTVESPAMAFLSATSTEPVAAAKPIEAAGDSIEAIAARLAETERQLAVAIAYDAVENVTNAYNFYLDEFDRAGATALFVANGASTLRNTGVAGGREPIRAAINEPHTGDGRPSGFLAIHQTLQPVIHVAPDGASAQFRLRLFETSGRLGEDGAWIAGIQQGAAVVENGIWKLSRMAVDYTWAADYSAGWSSAAPFASLAAVPFHYDNPVSGRARPTGSD